MREFGSDFNYDEFRSIGKSSLPQKGFLTRYVRSGREALRFCLKSINDAERIILLPAYSCRSVSLPFDESGCQIIYYGITEDMEIVIPDDVDLSKAIFLYINYFGKQMLSESDLIRLKECGTLIIKDSTQDYFNNRINEDIYAHLDFEICSLRKWLPISDGAVIHVYNENYVVDEPEIEIDNEWADKRRIAMKMKSEYLLSGEKELKREFRQIFNELNHELYVDSRIVAMSDISIRDYSSIDISSMSQKRKANAGFLNDRLQAKVNSILYQRNAVPLYYPIIVDNRDLIQDRLAKDDIYCPVIWPLTDSAKGASAFAEFVSGNMLAIPCDQRYDQKDMEYIAERIDCILSK